MRRSGNPNLDHTLELNSVQKPPILYKWRYHPHVQVHVTSGNYSVRTAKSWWEVRKALRLRYCVFWQELIDRKWPLYAVDQDQFDWDSDHLLLIENKTNRVVGTYRVRSSLFNSQFYSEGEFYLDKFLESSGTKMEIGRACIDPQFRNRTVLRLLWKGIHQYSTLIGARHIFGCSSLMTDQQENLSKAFLSLLKSGMLRDRYTIRPRKDFDIASFGYHLEVDTIDQDAIDPRKHIPPLLASYLRSGALVEGQPVYDEKFKCFDFMTVLDTSRLSQRVRRSME